VIRIGPHEIANPLFLAPMAGISDSLFRTLCSEYGAGYATSEMVSSDTLLHNHRKTRFRVRRAQGGLPHAVQIAGSDPVKLADAARFNVSNGADVIDINMGCPAKKVCNKMAGSALLADEKLVERILRSVVAAVAVPVTLKIRTGTERANRNGVRIAKLAESCGIQALAVHGRTRADRFTGAAEYDTIAAIKQAISIPVIANGDISTPEKAQYVLNHTRADGIMLGRAAQGYPWIFREVSHWLSTGEKLQAATVTETHSVLIRHVTDMHKLYGEYRGVRIARKHISWYCKRQRNAAAFRQRVNHVETSREQLALIDGFFTGLVFADLANEIIPPPRPPGLPGPRSP